MTIYPSRKNHVYIGFMYLLILVLIISSILAGYGTLTEDKVDIVQKVVLAILILITIGISYSAILALNGTFYTIDSSTLKYRSGLFKGSIDIQSIAAIQRSKYMSQGIRPALAFDGLKINFEEGRQLYVTPENEEDFLEKLLEINTKIVVIL